MNPHGGRSQLRAQNEATLTIGRDCSLREGGVAIGLNLPEILDAVLGPDAAAVLGTATRYCSPPFTNIVGSRELSTGKLSIGFGAPGRILLGGS